MHRDLPIRITSFRFSCVRRELFRPVPTTVVLACALILSQMSAGVALATVLTTGNVYPSDNPFPPDELGFEGLPIDGNRISALDPPNAQLLLEGILDIGNPFDPLDDTNVNLDVWVGAIAPGGVQIDGGSVLRFQHLYIGAIPDEFVGEPLHAPSGVVTITNFGSTFNNNPLIMPVIQTMPGAPPIAIRSKVPRDPNIGFDLHVGRDTVGELNISFGGRAEIQDAVVVGDRGQGTILVTGTGAYLGSGGFIGGDEDEVHSMIIGRLGNGVLDISMGGQVFAAGAAGANTNFVIAGVIGSDPFNLDSDSRFPRAGGDGQVSVDGVGSKWIVGGTLQVGGYHNATEGAGGAPDVEGDDAIYPPASGRGTLTVANQGLVSIVPPASETGAQEVDSLELAIGRYGRVNLLGGRIDLLGGFETGDDPNPLDTAVGVVNDGVISGNGSIITGRFWNRALGRVEVNAAQSLLVDTVALEQAGTDLPPLLNFGLIRAAGTETARAAIEFERAPADTQVPTPQDVQPFINDRLGSEDLPIDNGGRDHGLIHAQHATLQFRSDLINQGQLAFTAGDNIVSGDVLNMPLFDDNGNIKAEGVIFASGPDTKVVFEDDLFNLGNFIVEEGADVDVLGLNTFLTAGNLKVDVNADNLSHISVAGNAGIGGKLTVGLSGFSAGSIEEGDLFPILTAGGVLGGVNLSDPFNPTFDPMANPLFTEIQIDPLFAFLRASPDLVMVPFYTSDSVLLAVLSIAGFIGADFNGDLIVNALDLDIWRMNYGITMGATALQGDADGDGDVDFHDFIIWQQQEGGAPMPGLGSGGLPASGVPEPTSVAMLIAGSLLALAAGRRGTRI